MTKKISLWILLILHLTCQNYENPFENVANSDVHVLSELTTLRINNIDTASLFTSETLTLTTTVPELLDSFTVSVTANRIFKTKTIHSPTAQKYFFRISEFDTGLQKITILTFKKQGISTTRNYLFYVKTPLSQKNIIKQNLNDSVTLQTSPVGDLDRVLYNWVFAQQVFQSPFALKKIKISQMDNIEKTGYLYVSDSLYATPSATFRFSFYDTLPPSIFCLNGNYNSSTKTVSTPESTFLFRVLVYDGENQVVKRVTFNSQPADLFHNNVYSKYVNNVVIYSASNPCKMIVQAVDNNNFNNVKTDTFYVVFNALTFQGDTTLITVNKVTKDTIETQLRTMSISGTVSNSTGRMLSLKTQLNGSQLFDEPYPSGNGAWSSSFTLNSDISQFTILARGSANTIVAQKNITIILNSNLRDTTPPVLASVRINGVEGMMQFIEKDSVVIVIEAYDYESGITSMALGGVNLTVAPGQIKWSATLKNLNHNWETIVISIVNNQGDKTIDSVRLFSNKVPTALLPELPYAIRTDSIYSAEIITSDPDDDPVSVVIIHQPQGMKITQNNKSITYTASTTSTGKDSLVFQLHDGHINSEMYRQNFLIYDPKLTNKMIQLAGIQPVPIFLQAQKDTLRFVIRLSEQTGTPPYTFTTKVPAANFNRTGSDSVCEWIPELRDTGLQQIFLYVTDALRQSDTMVTSLLIVPPNKDTAKLHLKQVLNAAIDRGGIIFKDENDENAILKIEILDADHPLTENHLVAVTMKNSSTRFTADSLNFEVQVSPKGFMYSDSIIITLSDNTSNRLDTLKIPISIGIISPDSLIGLNRWYNPVTFLSQTNSTEWCDYKNNSYNLTAPTIQTIVNNGLNNNNTIRLNLSYLQDDNSGDWVQHGFSVFIVAKYDSATNEFKALISSTENDLSFFSMGISNDQKITIFKNANSLTELLPNAKSSLSVDCRKWNIYSFHSSGAQGNAISVLAGVNDQFESISLDNVSKKSDLMLGSSTKYFPLKKWIGEFAEVIIYDRMLSEMEYTRVINYLRYKFNLQ